MSVFHKEIIPNSDFYIVKFIKQYNLPYLLFVHGGPGFHCGVLEYLIDHHDLFQSLNCNIIMYDQRHCGRSPVDNQTVTHIQNVDDLNTIIALLSSLELKLLTIVGHSYGAKVLADYSKNYYINLPLVFIATAESLLRPRLNNLMLDLAYLKQHHIEQYNEVYNLFCELDYNKLWEISERLTPYFQKNKNRGSIYWAHVEWWHRVQEIQNQLNIPINLEVFSSVRKDIYLKPENSICDIRSIKNSKLWINGFHDFIMDGQINALDQNSDIKTFYQSAHYPHIEENERFSRVLNEFLRINQC